MLLQSNAISHWLGVNLESALRCVSEDLYEGVTDMQWVKTVDQSQNKHVTFSGIDMQNIDLLYEYFIICLFS